MGLHRSQSRTFQAFVVIALVCVLGHLSLIAVHNSKPIVVELERELERELKQANGLQECILVAMMSNMEDEELREWHRQSFLLQSLSQNITKKQDTPPTTGSVLTFQSSPDKSTLIDLRFAISLTDATLTSETILQASQKFHDIMYLRGKGSSDDDDSFATETNFVLMKEAEVLMQQWTSCTTKYFVRADTAYVVNYPALARSTESLPLESVYFGSMITRFPTPLRETRVQGGLAHSYLPHYAYGGFYGVSDDVLQILADPITVRTVVRQDISYQVPWQDSAVGLALFRSQVNLKHVYYLKGIYHMCSAAPLSCNAYSDFIAFKVSEEDKNTQSTGQQLRDQYNSLQDLVGCPRELHVDTADTGLVKLPHNRKSVDSTLWPVVECLDLSAEGQTFLSNVTREGRVAAMQLSEDVSCAEQFYLRENPQVAQLIEIGEYKSGREHYVQQGWEDFDKRYFCPSYCKGRRFLECSKDCDKERFYLARYPDVTEGIKNRLLPSARFHYVNRGRAEKRVWSCLQMHQANGLGDMKGCLDVWTKFIESTYAVVKTWPVWGETNDLPCEQCKALVLIDGMGGHPWIGFTLRVFRRFMGPDWVFYLIGPPGLTADWREQFSGPMVEIVDLPDRFRNFSESPRRVQELYMSKWLWSETIKCEYIVHTHPDVMMFRPGVEDFLGYAYVGAPVFPETYPAPTWSRICTKSTQCGGAGGLSIRRRSFTLEALKHCKVPWENGHYEEDLWYSECMVSMGHDDSMAHPVESNRLALGSKCEVDNPIGIDNAWTSCKSSVCAFAIADSMLFRAIYRDDYVPHAPCPEGEFYYFHKYNDVYPEMGLNVSAYLQYPGWDHFVTVGHREGRFYPCFSPIAPEKTA